MSEHNDDTMTDVIQRLRRASEQSPAFTEPPEGTWAAIAANLGFDQAASVEPGTGTGTAGPPPGDSGSSGVSRRTLFTGLGGVLVGAALGAGGMWVTQKALEPRDVPVKRATLTPLERDDEKLGVAELRPLDVGYSLVVDVPKGAEHQGGYVEVWLINVDLKRMVSVGVFTAGTAAKFHVSDALIEAGYLIVDLSNEEFDDEPRHSGDTIMRGELRA